MMSSIIRTESPNSDVVLCSFGLGVEHFGIPNGVRLDNGKDYKARDMFYPEGHYIVSEEDEIGERLKRQAESMERTEVAKPKTVEIVRNEKIEENIRRISMSDMERNYEDILNKNKARKKAVSDRQKELADKFKKKMLDRAYEKQA